MVIIWSSWQKGLRVYTKSDSHHHIRKSLDLHCKLLYSPTLVKNGCLCQQEDKSETVCIFRYCQGLNYTTPHLDWSIDHSDYPFRRLCRLKVPAALSWYFSELSIHLGYDILSWTVRHLMIRARPNLCPLYLFKMLWLTFVWCHYGCIKSKCHGGSELTVLSALPIALCYILCCNVIVKW